MKNENEGYKLYWCRFPSGLSIKAIKDSLIYENCKKASGTFEFIKIINENKKVKYMDVI